MPDDEEDLSLPTDTETEAALVLDNFKANPEMLQAGFKKLQLESKQHRLKAAGYKKEAQDKQAEIDRLTAEKTAAETKRLEEQQEYKKLYEQEKEDKAKTALVAQGVAIDAKLEAKLASQGIDSKFLKLVDRNGISIDSTGQVAGIEHAIEKMKTEYSEIITIKRPGDKPADDQSGTPPTDKANPAGWMKVPGTNLTYEQYASMSAGKTPDATSTPSAAKPVNVRGLSKSDYAKAEADFNAKLKGK